MFLRECTNRITTSSVVICSERCWCHSNSCRPTLYTPIVPEAFETSPSWRHLDCPLMVVVRSISYKNPCSYWDDRNMQPIMNHLLAAIWTVMHLYMHIFYQFLIVCCKNEHINKVFISSKIKKCMEHDWDSDFLVVT